MIRGPHGGEFCKARDCVPCENVLRRELLRLGPPLSERIAALESEAAECGSVRVLRLLAEARGAAKAAERRREGRVKA